MVKELQISAALFVKSTSSAGLQNSRVPGYFNHSCLTILVLRHLYFLPIYRRFRIFEYSCKYLNLSFNESILKKSVPKTSFQRLLRGSIFSVLEIAEGTITFCKRGLNPQVRLCLTLAESVKFVQRLSLQNIDY